MFPENDAFLDSTHSCTCDIILMKFLQHCTSYLSGIFCRHGKCKSQRREDHGFKIRTASCNIDPAKLNTKDAEKDQAQPEAWNRYSHKGNSSHKIIREFVLIYSGQDSKRYGNNDHHQKCQQRHPQRRPETGYQFICYRHFERIGLSHISCNNTLQPGTILHEKGLIKAKLMSCLFQKLWCRKITTLCQHDFRRITR